MNEDHIDITEKDIIQDAEARPWGMYRVLLSTPYTKVKEIEVLPSCRLSLQYHNHRSEVWTIVRGNGTVQIGKSFSSCIVSSSTDSNLTTGDSIHIPQGECHRITAGDEGVTFIEVQLSHVGVFDEEDITRIEDDYGRIEE